MEAAELAKEKELSAQLAVAGQREKELMAKQAAELKQKDIALQAALQDEAKMKASHLAEEKAAEDGSEDQWSVTPVQGPSSEQFLQAGDTEKDAATGSSHQNVSKPSLLAGAFGGRLLLKANILRAKDRMLKSELAAKDQQLQSERTHVQKMQAEANAKEVELETMRQALLHAASIPLPSATAQEANAARTALQSVDG